MAKKFKLEPVNRGDTGGAPVAPDNTMLAGPPVQAAPPKPAAPIAVPSVTYKPPNDDPYVVGVHSWGSGWIIVKLSNSRLQKRHGGTVAWRYNIPGNVKIGPFARAAGAVGEGHANLSIFPDYQTGHNAMKRLLFSGERPYANMSIWDAIHMYAPPEDNNDSASYANHVAGKVGVPTSTVLKTLNDKQRDLMIEAMKVVEGYRAGLVQPV